MGKVSAARRGTCQYCEIFALRATRKSAKALQYKEVAQRLYVTATGSSLKRTLGRTAGGLAGVRKVEGRA